MEKDTRLHNMIVFHQEYHKEIYNFLTKIIYKAWLGSINIF